MRPGPFTFIICPQMKMIFANWLCKLLILFGFLPVSGLETQWNFALFSSSQRIWNDSVAMSKRVAVLPFNLEQYKEEISCDSCRYLSPQYVEFVTENSLTDIFDKMLEKDSVFLISPEDRRFRAGNFQLMDSLRSIRFPFEKYFKNYVPNMVCYSGDAITSSQIRQKTSAIAGRLDADYLMLIRDVSMQIDPERRDKAKGDFHWKGKLVFWSVGNSRPEWVLNFGFKGIGQDLNKRLQDILENKLVPYLKSFHGGCAWDKNTVLD